MTKRPERGTFSADPEPGTFRDVIGGRETPAEAARESLQRPEHTIAALAAFRDHVYNPVSVLYPSCGFDASPGEVFRNVTFIDNEEGNKGCVESLATNGFTAQKQDIRTYAPEALHDLLILLNPGTPPDWATQHLQRGGYIIANDYHGTATDLLDKPAAYELRGAIESRPNSEQAITHDLEGLLEPVKNAAELERRRPILRLLLEQRVADAAATHPGFSADGAFEEVWARYRETFHTRMPSKRDAGLYIFTKK